MIHIGIDPGKTGALAVLNGNKLVAVHDYPGSETELAELMLDLSNEYPNATCVIESQQAFPGQGVVSTGKTMYGFGTYIGMLNIISIYNHWNIVEVSPRKWIYNLIGKQQDKSKHIEVAKELVHGSCDFLTKKKHHNRADAMLIAYWGYLQNV